MLSILKKSSVAAAVLVLLGSGTARAGTIEVKVPFSFVVNGQTLPAGEYFLERQGIDVMFIRGEKTSAPGVFVMTEPASGNDPAGSKPSLTFKPHQKEHELVGIWESHDQGFTVLGS